MLQREQLDERLAAARATQEHRGMRTRSVKAFLLRSSSTQ